MTENAPGTKKKSLFAQHFKNRGAEDFGLSSELSDRLLKQRTAVTKGEISVVCLCLFCKYDGLILKFF